jgi:mannosyl-oligosaccharide alpha-1,2-mannosidase
MTVRSLVLGFLLLVSLCVLLLRHTGGATHGPAAQVELGTAAGHRAELSTIQSQVAQLRESLERRTAAAASSAALAAAQAQQHELKALAELRQSLRGNAVVPAAAAAAAATAAAAANIPVLASAASSASIATSSLAPVTSTATSTTSTAAIAAAKAGGCEFQQDLDFQDAGDDRMMKQGLDKKGCCDYCASLGVQCAVAVYSSPQDSPPNACWVKPTAAMPVFKAGVAACWPSANAAAVKVHNKGALPTAPPRQLSPQEVADSGYVESLGGGSSAPVPAAHKGVDAEAHADAATQKKRCAAIQAGIKHAWDGYEQHAWGRDNLAPVSGAGSDGSFRHAVTMVDSLDTLWLAGLKSEFNRAVDWLKTNLPNRIANLGSDVSVFETTIRSLGGLEGAYALSKNPDLLKLSQLMGDRLSQVVSAAGVSPYTLGGGFGGMGCASLAESGTSQLEYNYLSQMTGKLGYAAKAAKFYDTLESHPGLDGLWPNCWGSGSGKITMGADGDSFYEYLIKAWLQTGRKDKRLWRMYNAAIDGMVKWLVHRNPADKLVYLANLHWQGGAQGTPDHAMEHLTCFVPGWLALGAQYQTDPERQQTHMRLAQDIAETCWQMYASQPTGIGPERVKGMKMDLSATDTREYILRPEAMEGWWYMWELTGDPKYREWGWKAFQAFEKHLKVAHGYASLRDVRSAQSGLMDRMESFWIAETLKYAYLLQDQEHQVRLDKFVMNTEAHPFPIADAS